VRSTLTAVLLSILVVACCVESMVVIHYFFPFSVGKRLNLADLYLIGLIVLMLGPTFRCARALRRLTPTRKEMPYDVPEFLFGIAAIGVLFALFPKFVTPVFGDYTKLVTFLLLWFGSFTVLGFVAVGARVDFTDREGETMKPGMMILAFVYNVGGGVGVEIARIVFKDSPATKETPTGTPRLFSIVVPIVVAVFFIRMLGSPMLRVGPPEVGAPIQTFHATK
jgi:hypothetical protein